LKKTQKKKKVCKLQEESSGPSASEITAVDHESETGLYTSCNLHLWTSNMAAETPGLQFRMSHGTGNGWKSTL